MSNINEKSASFGYVSPKANVVEVVPECVVATSFNMDSSSVEDMQEWSDWETE